MTDKSNYYDAMEDIDFSKFEKLNEQYHLFKSPIRSEQFKRYDAYVNNPTDGKALIELKSRDISLSQYDSIYIEPDKYDYLMKSQKRGGRAYYINFLNDAVLMYELTTLPHPKTKTNVKIYDKGAQKYKTVDRLILPKWWATLLTY